MSYQTGTANDVNDLLDKWRIFLLANGWTLDFWGPSGDGQALQVHRDGLFWSWYSHTTVNPGQADAGPYISGHMHTSFQNPGALIQPGASDRVRANRLSGPMQAYHFFSGQGRSGAYAHVVVEVEPGSFRHLGMGTLDRMGDYVSGQYVHALSWNMSSTDVNNPDSTWHRVPFDDWTSGAYQQAFAGTLIRCDAEGISPRYIEVNNVNFRTPRSRGGWRAGVGNLESGSVKGPYRSGSSELTGRAPLIPLWCAADRGNGLWSDIGQPADMRLVRIDNLEPGQEIALGSDTWLVFPVCRKNGPAGLQNSGAAGYAYRKVS